jgi:anti-sigma-K factor RskA
MTDDDLHQLAGPYVLGALDADDEARFAAHLAGCAPCQAEVRGFAAVRDQLGQATAEPAPAVLRAQVLARVATTPQEPVLLAERRAGGRRWRPAARGILAAAAAIVVVVGGFAYARVRADRTSAEALVEVLTASDAEVVALDGDDEATMRVVWSPARGEAVLVADDLAGPGAGQDFELWFLDGGSAQPALVFEPDGGRVREHFEVPEAGFQELAVTVEPDGGSQEPTLPPVYASSQT